MVLIEHHQGVDHGHVATDVAAASRHDDIDAVLPQVPTQELEIFSLHAYSPLR